MRIPAGIQAEKGVKEAGAREKAAGTRIQPYNKVFSLLA